MVIKCKILINSSDLEQLGIAQDPIETYGIIDFSAIYHCWESVDFPGYLNLCNEFGSTMFVAKLTLNEAAKYIEESRRNIFYGQN